MLTAAPNVRAQGYATTTARLPPVSYPSSAVKVAPAHMVLASSFLVGMMAARFVGPRRDGLRKSSAWDESVRDGLRAPGYRSRLLAADASDVLLGLSVSSALVIDPLLNARFLRQSPEVARQVALINAEVLSVALGTQEMVAHLVGRERPYGRVCGTPELDGRSQSCAGSRRYRSFYSGHTSVPFALAAATCLHHAQLGLSGNRAWLTCFLGFSVAATSGVLRMVSDNHYVSDVLVGAAVGSALGLSIPLLHYHPPWRSRARRRSAYGFAVAPTWGGLMIYGRGP